MDNNLFRSIWLEVRDYYAPHMSAPAAVRAAVAAITRSGHDACTAGKRMFFVDGELFEIKKHHGWSHFELIQHCIQL